MNEEKSTSTRKSIFKSIYVGLRQSSIAALLAGLVSVASSLISLISFSSAAHPVEDVKYLYFSVIIASAVIIVASLIIFFVLIIRRRTAQSTRLRKQVSDAFVKALDQSSFNPSRKVKNLDVRSSL